MDDESKVAPSGTPLGHAKLRVFISYSRDDIDFADQLEAGLKVVGFEPTIDRHGISGGEDWKARLGTLILDAETVVFVLSPASAIADLPVGSCGGCPARKARYSGSV
jgi:hypothetical protein